MSIYENYTLSIINDKLLYSYLPTNKKVFEISSNSNTSFVKLNSLEYNFLDSTLGFTSNNNSITYRATSNYFTGNVYIDGLINAREFPSQIPLLDINNKIPISYLPNITSGLIYNNDAIGIGTTSPETAFHLKIGDAYIQNGRLGIGTKASYNFHLDKNDLQIGIPAFVISSSNRQILSVYPERQTVIINDSNNSMIIDSNVKLNVNGLTQTTALRIPNVLISSNDRTIVYNTLAISNLTTWRSDTNNILIDSNVDIILNNTSMKNSLSNINRIEKNLEFLSNISLPSSANNNEFSIINNKNKFIINSNNSTIVNNLIASNISLINYDSLTSNPYKDSVFDIKGKIRLYNDSINIITDIFINDIKLFIITNSNLIIYDLLEKTFINENLNLSGAIIKTNEEYFSYYLNSYTTIFVNNTPIININNVIDYVISNNLQTVYIINTISNKKTLTIYIRQLNTFIKGFDYSSPSSDPNEEIVKIDIYNNVNYQYKLVVLSSKNNLYVFDGSSFTLVSGLSGTIIDFACGNSHTIVLTTVGVYSFGLSNDENNSKFFRGYSLANLGLSNIQAGLINLLFNKFIVKVKAYKNSSIVIDKDGYVYIFGFINTLFESINIYKIENLSNINKFICNNNKVFLLSYFNDIFTLTESNKTSILILPDYFYGVSIKSRGSIIIGGNNFYDSSNSYLPKNSLLVENYVGIGSNIIGDPKYSLIVSGNINIQNGSIFSNGQPIITSLNNSVTEVITVIDGWSKINNSISYIQGNVGIGIRYPRENLHINGNILIESNLYITGNLITNEYKPLIINQDKNIYYNGKFGINNNNPLSTLDIYDGDLKITNILNDNGLIVLNNQSNIKIYNTTINTSYINPIKINSNAQLIITSYYNNLNDNNNTIEIYKYSIINNQWNTYHISGILNSNNYFGQSFAMSDNGSIFFIGAFNEKNIIQPSIISGGIYQFTFNSNNEIQQQNLLTYLIPYSLNYIFYQIGANIACSGNGLVLISTIYNYNKLLYINDISTGIIKILNFNDYDIYHSTFNSIISQNQFNPKIIYIDTTETGDIIIINFIYDSLTSSTNISLFPFFNFYIIKNYQIYFLKYPVENENSFVTSININAKGNRIFITTQSGNHFIYDATFTNINYKEMKISNINFKYFDIKPTYDINLKDSDIDFNSTVKTYRGKMAKSGNNIYLSNYRRIINYKLDNLVNRWISKEVITEINNQIDINNYNFDIDYKGLKLAISYIYKLHDTTSSFDKIKITNNLLNIYKEQTSLYINNSNLNINIDTYFTSNLYANYIYGDGSNISNIQINNITSVGGSNQIVFLNNNSKFENSSNLQWNNNNKYLYTTGNIYVNSNIETYNGSIISGYNITVNSNLYIYSNVYAYSNIYVNNDINVKSNITVEKNIYGNSNLNINNNITATQSISTLYGSIISGNSLIVNNDISTTIGSINSANNIQAINNISTITGDIISGNNITAESSISTLNGSIISGADILTSNGIIKSGTDIIATSNIIGYSNLYLSSNLKIIEGSIESKYDIKTLNGNLIAQLNIIGSNDLIITSNISTTNGSITAASNIYATYFYGNGSNISNITFNNIIGGGDVINGGTGHKFLNSNGLLIGNGDNSIIITSNLYWNNLTEELIFSNNARIIIENKAPIINVSFLSNSHFSEYLNINNGGTGNTNYNDKSIIFYSSNTSNLISSSNLYWLNENNSLYVNGYIYGDGSNISNLNPQNLLEIIDINKGGTGNSNFDVGNILIGNGNLKLLTTSNLNWDYSTNTLNISNVNILNNLIINGSNSSNIDARKIVNIISLENGGLGVSNIESNEFIFGFNKNKITSSSNVKWNESIKTLQINTNLFSSNIYSCNFTGNGFNISNLDIAKIGGVMPFEKGGLGFSIINKNNFIYANENNTLSENNNIKWFNDSKTMQITGDLNIGNSNFLGYGYNIKNINAANILGVIPIVNGGTGKNTFTTNKIIFSDTSKLETANALHWDNTNHRLGIGISPNATLHVNGDIKTNSMQISTATYITSNNKIGIGKIPQDNLEVVGRIYGDEISIGQYFLDTSNVNILKSYENKIGININEPQAELHVNGTIICDRIQAKYINSTSNTISTSVGDLSSINQGTLQVNNGGTGLSSTAINQLFFGGGGQVNFKQSVLYRVKTLPGGIGGCLGINYSNALQEPAYNLDVNGDINFTGTIRNKTALIPSIASFNFGVDTQNIICTNKQLFVGYSNADDNYKLKVNGNIYVAGYITGLSDIRYKTNISDIDNSLNKIEQLKGVYYNLMNEEKRSIGLIAQDVEKIIPEVVHTNKDNTKSIAYGNMIALLVESIKELNIKIKKLEEKL